MRYTEARLSRIAGTLLEDIDKETVDFRPNYDDSEARARSSADARSEPADQRLLRHRGRHGDQHPAAQPDGDHQRDHRADSAIPTRRSRRSARWCQGPDFPTGGFILGRQGILDYYTRGRGSLKLRAKAAIEKMRQGSRSDHRHRDSVPGQQGAADRADARRWSTRRSSKASPTFATRAIATACASSSS